MMHILNEPSRARTYCISSSDTGMNRRVWLDIASFVSMPEESAMSDLVLAGQRSVSVRVPADSENMYSRNDQSRSAQGCDVALRLTYRCGRQSV